MQNSRRGPRGAHPSCLALALTASLASSLGSGTGFAQPLHGALIATVTDEQGGAVAGALGRLSSPALIGRAVERRTNSRGQLRFSALPPGTYELEITMSGFTPMVVSTIEIGGGDVLERTLVLQPAGVAESIVVRSETSRRQDQQPGFATRFGAEDLRTIPTRRTGMFDFSRAAPSQGEPMPTRPCEGGRYLTVTLKQSLLSTADPSVARISQWTSNVVPSENCGNWAGSSAKLTCAAPAPPGDVVSRTSGPGLGSGNATKFVFVQTPSSMKSTARARVNVVFGLVFLSAT